MNPLYFHPLANLFPLMNGTKFEELVADIKAHGLREQITLYQGKVLDGRNRYRACLKLKLAPQVDLFSGTGGEFTQFDGDDDDARAFVISKNIHRRHLTTEQRRELLVKLVAAQPQKSDRAIAKEVGTAHTTVARARKKAVATGAVAPVENEKRAPVRTARRASSRPRRRRARQCHPR
jgi:ParB-like chromosome segregation protein Spo0J